MIFLLVTGPKDSGKTTTIRNLFEYYKKNGWIVKEFNKRAGKDFNGVLVNAADDREIIFHSDTDLFICIDHMVEYIEKHPKAKIVITSCRNKPDPMRDVLFAKLNLKANGNQYQEGWFRTDAKRREPLSCSDLVPWGISKNGNKCRQFKPVQFIEICRLVGRRTDNYKGKTT